MSKPKSDQCSIIKRLIMQHVMKERPDFVELVENINRRCWVIMKNLPGAENDANEVGQMMCEVVHAHGEFATVRVCLQHSGPMWSDSTNSSSTSHAGRSSLFSGTATIMRWQM